VVREAEGGAACLPQDSVRTEDCNVQACDPPTIDGCAPFSYDALAIHPDATYNVQLTGIADSRGAYGEALTVRHKRARHTTHPSLFCS
jgi:hypothetical protein